MQPTTGQNPKPNIQGISAPGPAAPEPLKAEIVNNIPVKAPAAAPGPKPLDEDDELDKIMQDVGHDLSQLGKKAAGKHFSLFKHRQEESGPVKTGPPKVVAAKVIQPPAAPKPDITVRRQPVKAPAPAPVPPPAAGNKTPAVPVPAPKTAKHNQTPAAAVTAAVAVTGVLIAAAFYAYK